MLFLQFNVSKSKTSMVLASYTVRIAVMLLSLADSVFPTGWFCTEIADSLPPNNLSDCYVVIPPPSEIRTYRGGYQNISILVSDGCIRISEDQSSVNPDFTHSEINGYLCATLPLNNISTNDTKVITVFGDISANQSPFQYIINIFVQDMKFSYRIEYDKVVYFWTLIPGFTYSLETICNGNKSEYTNLTNSSLSLEIIEGQESCTVRLAGKRQGGGSPEYSMDVVLVQDGVTLEPPTYRYSTDEGAYEVTHEPSTSSTNEVTPNPTTNQTGSTAVPGPTNNTPVDEDDHIYWIVAVPVLIVCAIIIIIIIVLCIYCKWCKQRKRDGYSLPQATKPDLEAVQSSNQTTTGSEPDVVVCVEKDLPGESPDVDRHEPTSNPVSSPNPPFSGGNVEGVQSESGNPMAAPLEEQEMSTIVSSKGIVKKSPSSGNLQTVLLPDSVPGAYSGAFPAETCRTVSNPPRTLPHQPPAPFMNGANGDRKKMVFHLHQMSKILHSERGLT